MERLVLGDPIVYLHQCGSQKFFTGKQGENALFLFDRFAGTFCTRQIIVQFPPDADHEPAQPASFQFVSG